MSRQSAAPMNVRGRQMQAQQQQYDQQVEEHEAKSSVSAQAGLNLNLFAAFSGIFGSKSKKTTDTAPDGSSHSVEDSEGVGRVNGVGHGTLNAVASGKAHSHEKHRKMVEAEHLSQIQQTDHLGIGETQTIEKVPKRKK